MFSWERSSKYRSVAKCDTQFSESTPKLIHNAPDHPPPPCSPLSSISSSPTSPALTFHSPSQSLKSLSSPTLTLSPPPPRNPPLSPHSGAQLAPPSRTSDPANTSSQSRSRQSRERQLCREEVGHRLVAEDHRPRVLPCTGCGGGGTGDDTVLVYSGDSSMILG